MSPGLPRRPSQASMAGENRLSAHFARQAESDLELAQKAAMLAMRDGLNQAEPGYALGACMHLAQQALEKRLKSVVLLLEEIQGVPHADGSGADAILERCLGHPIYSGICRYRSTRLASLCPSGALSGSGRADLPVDGAAAVAKRREASLRLVCNFWDKYSKDRRWQLASWRHSVGMRLEDSERRVLEPRHAAYAGLLTGLAGGGIMGTGHIPPGRPMPGISTRECMDARALGRRRAEHADFVRASGLPETLDREFRRCQTDARTTAGSRRTADDLRRRAARRAMLEFGLMLMLCHSGLYMALLPHGTAGRYPRLQGDHATASLYGRQAEQVLYHLFIGVPHGASQLSGYCGRMGRLWDAVSGSQTTPV